MTTERKLATAYTTAVDWTSIALLTNPTTIDSTAASLLELEAPFTETRVYDALNRVTSVTAPDSSEVRATYNRASLLDAVDARVRGSGTWTSFVSNIDYDAKGQRKVIAYGNGTSTAYDYDPLTWRLKTLVTKCSRARPSSGCRDRPAARPGPSPARASRRAAKKMTIVDGAPDS